MMPLIAWQEHRDNDASDADFCSTHVVSLVDAAVADAAAARLHRPDIAEVRHPPAYVLARQRRYTAAPSQPRIVDGSVGCFSWRY
ncbi:hypothetical protein [Streptomyces sp. NPDC051546]|uniref:hypothetical protein n=1 Tax=Streptomyces sp. NPDC051546 TaxID=3365655 RepID=UPI0037AC6551